MPKFSKKWHSAFGYRRREYVFARRDVDAPESTRPEFANSAERTDSFNTEAQRAQRRTEGEAAVPRFAR
jgi:hypothetical protein